MSRRLAWALAAMTAAQAAVYVARPMTSYRLLGIGADSRAVGLVAAAFALVPLFVAIPLGRFADRRGGGSLLAVGCAVQAIACLLLAVGDSAVALGAASAVLGLGHLGLALGVQEVIARESHADRHDQHFGLLTAGVSLGQLAGPLIGGFIVGSAASLTSGTRVAMLVAAAIAGGAFVCALLAGRGAVAVPAPEHRAGRTGLWSILRIRGVPGGIFASLAVLSAADVFTAYMPVLGEQRGIDPELVGVLLAIRAGASIFGRVGIGGLVRRIGRLRLITISATAAAAAFAAITATDDFALLAVLSAVAGIGLGFGQPLSMTLVVQLVPSSARGTALAVRLTGNRLGQVAAPALAGVIAGGAGTGPVFWLLAVMLVASGGAVHRRTGSPEREALPARN